MSAHPLDLSGRVAVVVGGTSGLGRAIAKGLARAGADVVATGRRENLAAEAAAEVEALGRRSLVHGVDVSNRASIDALRDAVLRAFGNIDILLNAAGRTKRIPTKDFPEAEWEAIFDANVTGMLRTCQSFYEPLKKNGRGRIINIASLTSYVAFHEVAAYSASKAAVLSLTQSLGCEWAKDGINVNAIAPGVFKTPLNEHLITGTPRGNELLMRTPMGRFGTPDELIGASILLASDAASFITGQCLGVDGGFLASGVNT
jgi:NAD(P)-dependent dehydrogenase (short-subunit alcohol dehydrogenase family)